MSIWFLRCALVACFLLVVVFISAQTPKRVAILGPLPPLTDGALAAATQEMLTRAGYASTILSPEDLASPERFNARLYALLVVPNADTFPPIAQENLLAYLRERGRLLCLGKPPFTRYVYRSGDSWKTWNALLAELPVTGTVVDIEKTDTRKWTRAANDPSRPATLQAVDAPVGRALRFDFPHFTQWDNFTPPPQETGSYPAGSDLLVFWAKGDANTDALVIEWKEKDRSRWMATVPLTPQWQRHALGPQDFRYWPDNPAQGRGGPNDHFHPEQAAEISFGLAQSHAPMPPGPKTFWLADIRTARAPEGAPRPDPPVLESLSPGYKIVSPDSPEMKARPEGSRLSDWRPQLRYLGATAETPPGRLRLWRGGGTEWIYRPYTGPYAGAAWGAATGWPVSSSLFDEILRDWFIAHAGPSSVCYRPDEAVEFIVRVVNRGEEAATLTCEPRLRPLRTETPLRETPPRPVSIPVLPQSERTVTLRATAALPPGEYAYSLVFTDRRGVVVDTVENRFTVLSPRRGSSSVSVKGGEFLLNGAVWRPVGINFWPLWIGGQEREEFWAVWLSPQQYDPELVEQNLALAERLGMNMVSIQYTRPEQARPLNDFLIRCRNHHIRANVFVAGGHPLYPDLPLLSNLIAGARLADNDAVFAYDVAWEPHVGNQAARRRFDTEWERWILDYYGSVEKAEKDWECPAPRESGRLTNPPDTQFMQDGPWRKMIAAYRRFMDDRISRGYRQVRQVIRALDKKHLIGARSGYGGNGSLYVEGVLAFDLRAGAKHLDFISPEGYSLAGDWPAFRGGGGFTTAYARWAGNGKPVFWAEFGQSVYPQTSPSRIAAQAAYHENVYRMILDSAANGAAGWWWPGGLRVDENSDYGIIAPDGLARPAAEKLRQYAPLIQSATPPHPTPGAVLSIDRDRDARGYAGVWIAGRDAYLALREKGQFPVIRTEATDRTTATMPLTAVGNVPADGANPLKYANAEFNEVKVVGATLPRFSVTVTLGNTGEAAWAHTGAGRVALLAKADGKIVRTVPLPVSVGRFVDIALRPFDVEAPPNAKVTLRLAILGRTAEPLELGETYVVERK